MALALSGGGDSTALLHMAAAWARRRGRPLLALTVDHGLHPDSGEWTRRAGETARDLGVVWRPLRWEGDKPTTGVPAAARRARHALIAEASRDAGARVVLMAHTADDVAEGEAMRAAGGSLGRLREWGPSPVWPQGRGIMVFRPTLATGRIALRDWLVRRGVGWIDDPANLDPRHPRIRARRALGGFPCGEPPAVHPPRSLGEQGLCVVEDVVELSRTVSPRVLAMLLVCVGGGERPPRGERVSRLTERLRAGEDFTADLAGARIEAAGQAVRATREAGALVRQAAVPTRLDPRRETVWDGRWALRIDEPGWRVAAARGFRASLRAEDQARLRRLPAAVRPGRPVLIRDDGSDPILAEAAGRARPLIEQRLALALDTTTHETDLY